MAIPHVPSASLLPTAAQPGLQANRNLNRTFSYAFSRG